MDLGPVEVRVLGCLIEKQRTTPDQYPLSLNALRLACNQSTSRDPVVDYDEGTIRAALDRLGDRGWTRLASGPGSRAAKFRHLLDDALQLTPSQLAVLAVLMLRGPQTVAELRTRSERLYPFGSADDVAATLQGLAERELVAEGARHRWQQLLRGGEEPAQPAHHEQPSSDLEARVAELERVVAELQRRLGD
ncbi:MAG TPA: YceH family protein [Gaiellaceae bacterium]|nr:YceH family protein [Gaiellaceae bacterium]